MVKAVKESSRVPLKLKRSSRDDPKLLKEDLRRGRREREEVSLPVLDVAACQERPRGLKLLFLSPRKEGGGAWWDWAQVSPG